MPIEDFCVTFWARVFVGQAAVSLECIRTLRSQISSSVYPNGSPQTSCVHGLHCFFQEWGVLFIVFNAHHKRMPFRRLRSEEGPSHGAMAAASKLEGAAAQAKAHKQQARSRILSIGVFLTQLAGSCFPGLINRPELSNTRKAREPVTGSRSAPTPPGVVREAWDFGLLSTRGVCC